MYKERPPCSGRWQEKQSQIEQERGEPSPYLHEYLENWLERKKSHVSWSTWETYEGCVKTHLAPYFKKLKIRLDEVKPKHIKAYYDFKFLGGRLDKKKGGLSVITIKKHASILQMAFQEALIVELVERNPAAGIPLPRQEDVESKAVFLTDTEANDLLSVFRGHELQPLVYVALYYGLRRSEVLGLKWSAVDFEGDTIRICHTVVKNRKIKAQDKTKTAASKGTYQLLPEVKKVLLDLRENCEQHRKAFGRSYQKSDYIFVKPDGSQYRPDCMTRGFQRVLKKHGLKKMRFHDLRHSTASILHDKGWDIRDIQDWLRHADFETTANIYTHISKQRKTKLAKDMENTFRL